MEVFFKKKALFEIVPKGSPGGPWTAPEQPLAITDTPGIAGGVAGSRAPPDESPWAAGPADMPLLVDGFVIWNNNGSVRKSLLGGRCLNRSRSQQRPRSRPMSTQQVAPAVPRRL